jgi:DNA topoisomerase-1
MPRDSLETVSATAPQGLIYVSDTQPGISRRRSGRGFSYLDLEGRAIRDLGERARLQRLAIPPAYERVWICPLPNGHLQYTGYDAAGRKQYRYHPDWSTWRAEAKYGQLASFGMALARLRRRVQRDLEREAPGDLAFSLAALAMLLDHAHIRIGSAFYTAANGTFGATTLLTRHLSLQDGCVRLRYRAKGGRLVSQTLRDRRLHRILEDISDLPGRHLFTYIALDGAARPVASHHVNAYLAEATGVEGVSGKTFRTWAGTLAAFVKARQTEGKLRMRDLCQAAAAELHNTPTICRASYIHPSVLDLVTLKPAERVERLEAAGTLGPRELRADERRLLGFLSGVG